MVDGICLIVFDIDGEMFVVDVFLEIIVCSNLLFY